MKAVYDNMVSAKVLATCNRRFDDFGPGDAIQTDKEIRDVLQPLIDDLCSIQPSRGLKGAWFVRTQARDPMTKPHRDRPGFAAVVHLSEITGGEFIFCEDGEVIDFVPGRLVFFTEEHEHQHRPPTSGDRRTLVMRFS